MSMGSVRAGQAYIELSTRDGKLQKGLQNASAKLKAFSAASTAIGRDVMFFSGTMLLPFAAAVKGFRDFDSQMRVVRAVTGATGKEFDLLKDKAREIGKTTDYTAVEVAQAMTSLGRAGFSPEEINAAIAPVMNLARATDTELAAAADIAANTLRIFQLEASKMGEVTDYLTVAANGSAQTLTDLFEALKVAGPQAKTAGEDIRETAAALGVMANMGIKGSLAGTSLRKAYLQFADPKIQAFLKDYNIKTVDASGNLRKMRDIMVDLTKVMAKMGSAERLAFAKDVFDLRGMTGGLAITADPKKVDEFMEKLSRAAGVANTTAREMKSGIGGVFARFMSGVQELGITVGEIVGKKLVPFWEWITNAINAFSEWCKENEELVLSLGALAALVGGVGGMLIALGAGAKIFAGALALCTAGVGVLKGAVLAFVGLKTAWAAAMAAYASATALGTGAVTAFGVAIKALCATNPVGWAILAAGALYALSQAFSGVKQEAEIVSNSMYDQAQKARSAAESDTAAANRLKALSEQQKLSTDEMKEAKILVDDLSGKYGKIGVVFDTAAGKVNLLAGAFNNLSEAIKQKEITALDKQIAEHDKNIQAYQDANSSMNVEWHDWLFGFGKVWSMLDGSRGEAVSQNDLNITKQLLAKRRAEARRAALLGGKPGAGSGAGKPGAGAVTFQNYLDAKSEIARLQDSFAGDDLSAVDREIEKINKANESYKKLLATMIAYQKQRAAKTSGAEKTLAEREVSELEARLKNADAEAAKQRSKVRGKESAKAEGELSKLGKAFSAMKNSIFRDRKLSELDTGISRTMSSDPRAAVGMLLSVVGKLENAVASADKEYQRAFAAANRPDADGIVRLTDQEKERLRGISAKYRSRQDMLENYRGKLDQARNGVAGAAMSLGSFSLLELRGQLGGRHTAAERTALAAEKQNKLTERTNKKLDEILKSENLYV